jgi:hypothetical protein
MEKNGIVIIEEKGSTEEKKGLFHWAKLWAWSSIILAVASPVIGAGIGILAISMATEENADEVNIVSAIGIGIGSFFFILDLLLKFVKLF